VHKNREYIASMLFELYKSANQSRKTRVVPTDGYKSNLQKKLGGRGRGKKRKEKGADN
jgi:hypothetical protein